MTGLDALSAAVDVPVPMSDDGDSVAPVGPMLALFNMVEDNAAAVDDEPMYAIKCEEGSIALLKEPVYLTDQESNLEHFQKFMPNMERLDSVAHLKYNSFGVMSWTGGIYAEPIAAKLKDLNCSIIGVNCVEPDVCTAIFLRVNTRMKFALGPELGPLIGNIYTLKPTNGKTREFNRALIFRGCKAWMHTGTNVKVNFKISNAPPEYTVADLKSEWATMEKDEIETVILACEDHVLCW